MRNDRKEETMSEVCLKGREIEERTAFFVQSKIQSEEGKILVVVFYYFRVRGVTKTKEELGVHVLVVVVAAAAAGPIGGTTIVATARIVGARRRRRLG